jgi:hypothetical protein
VHYAILVEDLSGKKALDVLVPKIIGDGHTFVIHAYKGIGRIPKNMRDASNASKRILLDNLPKLLKGYGRTFQSYGAGYPSVVILVCDLDDKCLKAFKTELLGILNACNPRPEARFCFAIEEGEAWLLGDLNAVRLAYPKAKSDILDSYINDSICGTWERLADALFTGGSQSLSSLGWHAIGAEKSEWADAIAPKMDVNGNNSPSFQYFRDKLLELA